MTVGSQVKQTLASLKSIEANLNSLSIKTLNQEAQHAFHEACLKTRKVVHQIEKRVGELEVEEPQYKGS